MPTGAGGAASGAVAQDVEEAGLHLIQRDADQVGPGLPVDGQLRRVGAVDVAGLPVHHQVAVGGVEHGVDPATDDGAGDHHAERHLDGPWTPGRELSRSNAALSWAK